MKKHTKALVTAAVGIALLWYVFLRKRKDAPTAENGGLAGQYGGVNYSNKVDTGEIPGAT